ncbi:Asp-tRNA(Asn)/Glu-tRNA(Gln) amidotransferase subunit GatB [Candidatus Dependentiae bacterium]|nr:MAG: Asp-tRNA(Asn)/Glu-tRNA(Gln) amidotransferase subunit GatB [Candidatus Dependentiae bacterium]
MAQKKSILTAYPDYEVVIGIEVHVQLTTKSKIFCSCKNTPEAEPNSNICQICTGQPGVLPVLNEQVIAYAVQAALATNSAITPLSFFDRKHYFYPDLPKGYQITQQYLPICEHGHVPIRLEDGSTKNIRLRRIHIEEDAGKNTHVKGSGESLVDLNRAGTPLLEVVTEPDIRSADQARAYLKMLRAIVQYLGICTGNMQEGAFRADTNISVRKKGTSELGTKCELKNINSFKYIADAIEHEIERQILLVASGKQVKQETRLWDNKQKITIPMRSKEEAADYRYFRDPDLPGIQITNDYIATIKNRMPELPYEKFDRYISSFGLSAYEADIIVEDLERAKYFEKAYALRPSKNIVNWFLRDVLGYTNEHNIFLKDFLITPEKLVSIITLLENGTVNNSGARIIFDTIAQNGGNPVTVVQEKGLQQVDSSDQLEEIAERIVKANPDVVANYKAGKDKLFGFFVGQMMKETGGKGNPHTIQTILKKLLDS